MRLLRGQRLGQALRIAFQVMTLLVVLIISIGLAMLLRDAFDARGVVLEPIVGNKPAVPGVKAVMWQAVSGGGCPVVARLLPHCPLQGRHCGFSSRITGPMGGVDPLRLPMRSHARHCSANPGSGAGSGARRLSPTCLASSRRASRTAYFCIIARAASWSSDLAGLSARAHICSSSRKYS